MREEIDACFICTTSYQVIAAIAIQKQLRIKADLFIMGQFNDYENVAQRMDKAGVFNDVYCIDEREMQEWRFGKDRKKIKFYIKKGLIYLFPKSFVKRYIPLSTKYNQVYISSNAFTGRIISRYMMKHDRTELAMFDDGTGSYCNPEQLCYGTIEKVLNYCSFGRRVALYHPAKYLYSPELYKSCAILDQNCVTKRIDNWSKDPETVRVLDEVFEYNVSDNVRGRAVIFDSLERKTHPDCFDIVIQCYQYISEILGKDVYIKLHPRNYEDKDYYQDQFNIYQSKLSIPFELILSHSDIHNVILVSDFSTACFTPKILFEREPVIILLYKIIQENIRGTERYENSVRFMEAFKRCYTDPRRVIIPTNFEELKNELNALREGKCI